MNCDLWTRVGWYLAAVRSRKVSLLRPMELHTQTKGVKKGERQESKV